MMAIEAPVIFFFILYGDHVIPRSRLFNEIKTPRLETERNEIIVKNWVYAVVYAPLDRTDPPHARLGCA